MKTHASLGVAASVQRSIRTVVLSLSSGHFGEASIGERSPMPLSSLLRETRSVLCQSSGELLERRKQGYTGAEQWIIGNYAYYPRSRSLSGHDITDPGKPVLTDTVKVDARLINDISTTADGKIPVIREGASSRKNGIVFTTPRIRASKPISDYSDSDGWCAQRICRRALCLSD